ncbi:MAG: GNAT family N-acetyltransferase [Paramuribaculum sp.]|nr:GNAT family N-acetyltransferase [Paramuribaculum sp.]
MNALKDISLRALEPEDATLVFMWENDRSLWQYGSTQAPLSLHQIRQYIDSYNDDVFSSCQLRLMITLHGTPVGTVDLYDIDPLHRRAGLGIMVDKTHQNQGIARQAIGQMAEYARDRLGLHQLWCICATTNNAAVATFQSAGFSICGRFRSWLRSGTTYTDAFALQKLL